uniref:Phospholipase-like protein n=1 Tax=Tanacetum cinerariifolium TaxID=118510 RepID=A0A6L2JTX6_TANCI|nr:phospholipase-like protein [Tanacetum cinerariifolium]
MGKEDMNCIPEDIVSLVEDFDSWNDYPWGNYVDLQHNSILVVSILLANSHEGLNETRVTNNDMLLLEGETGFLFRGRCYKSWSNKDKQPTLADVLDEVLTLRKEVSLVKFDDARISKLERLLNDNFMFRNDISPNDDHNAVNQGLSGSANHLMSTCSRLDIDNVEVTGDVIGIHKAHGKNDSPNGNQNGVNNGLSVNLSDILDGEIAGALIGIHKADRNNDSPNVNHNAVNKGLSYSANDLMSDMDNGKVVVAGIGIHKADGQNDIPNTNDNVVNQGIYGSANDLMLRMNSTCSSPDMDNGEVAIAGMGIHKADGQNDILNANDNAINQVIIGIDKEDENNDYTYSQRKPSTLDVLVDEFTDDFMNVLNDEESIPNYSLDDMKLQDEEKKLIFTPAHAWFLPMSKQRGRSGIERNYVLRSVKERKQRMAMSLDSPFSQQVTTTPAPPKIISKSVNEDYIAPPEFIEVYFLVNEPKKHWCLAELHISIGVVTFYDSLGWVCENRRPWWRTMKRTLQQQLTLYLNEHVVLQSKGIVVETYEIKYMFPKVVRLPVKSLLQFRAVSKSWKSCVDSSAFFFKYGVRTYLGTNLVVVGLDGNNQIIPISTGVSQGETGESWT